MEQFLKVNFFSYEEIVEALTMICNAKSTKICVELHAVSEYTGDAKSIHFQTGLKKIYVHFENYPDTLCEGYTEYDMEKVKGHEDAIALELVQMPYNDDLVLPYDDEIEVCSVSNTDGTEIRATAFGISPIDDEDIEMFSEQFHEQIPGKIKLKSLKCIPYPGEGSNSIALRRARNVTMNEILQMAKEILINAETEGRLSKCHCVEDLVIEKVTINLAAGPVLISLGS